MAKNKNIQRNKISFFVFIFVAFFLAMSTVIGAEWVEPSVDPPGGNVEPPINQGSIHQYKLGGLTVGTNLINEDNVLNVYGASLFSGGALQATGGILVNTSKMTIDGVDLEMQNGANLFVNKGNITVSNDENNINSIYLETYGDSSTGLYVYDSSPPGSSIGIFSGSYSNTAIFGYSDEGTGVFGQSDQGAGVWGYSPILAGRFDGPVVFHGIDSSEEYGVVIENDSVKIGGDDVSASKGDLYVSRGISTVSKDESVGNSNVYADNTIVTDSLCLGAKTNEEYQGIDGSGLPTGSSCRTRWPGPNNEDWYIWNADNHSGLAEANAYQGGSIRIDGNINNAISFDENNVTVTGELLVTEDVFNIGGTLTADSGITVNGGIIMDSGELNVRNNRIIGIPDPGSGSNYDNDAVPKSYVDDLIGDNSFWEMNQNSWNLEPKSSLGIRGVSVGSTSTDLEAGQSLISGTINISSTQVDSNFLSFKTFAHSYYDQMVVTSKGEIGLGTSTPNRAIHVYKVAGDNAEIDIQSVSGEGNHWGIYNERDNANNDLDNSLRFWNDDNNVLTLQSNGGVKIDELSGGASNRCLYVNANGVIGASTGDCGSFSDNILSIACNPGGTQDIPEKALQIGDASYIYDSSCPNTGEVVDTGTVMQTLHIQSGEAIDINATGELRLKVGNNYGIKISGDGKVTLGGWLLSTPKTSYTQTYNYLVGGAAAGIQGNLNNSTIEFGFFGRTGNTEGLESVNATYGGVGRRLRSSTGQYAYSGIYGYSKGDNSSFSYGVEGVSESGTALRGYSKGTGNILVLDSVNFVGGHALVVDTNGIINTSGKIKISEGTTEYSEIDTESTGLMKISTPNGVGNSVQISSGVNTGNSISEAITLKTNQTIGSTDELLQITNNATNLFTVLGNGNVGIGTTVPGANLHIKTASGNAEIDVQSGSSPKWGIYQDDGYDDLRFWNVDNRMTITNEGNVGIGTTAPSVKLDINGDVHVSSDISTNRAYVTQEIIAGNVSESNGASFRSPALRVPQQFCVELRVNSRISFSGCTMSMHYDLYTDARVNISGSYFSVRNNEESANRYCQELGYTGAYEWDYDPNSNLQFSASLSWQDKKWNIYTLGQGYAHRNINIGCY
ncbi:MAG: hypothetical protein PHW42_02205 [Patescibacteria group bacterium]|nr:hypothetical protein [Patescibacteria group bacterium]